MLFAPLIVKHYTRTRLMYKIKIKLFFFKEILPHKTHRSHTIFGGGGGWGEAGGRGTLFCSHKKGRKMPTRYKS